MKQNVLRVLHHAFILAKYSAKESLSRPRQFLVNNITSVIFSSIFIIPGIILREHASMSFSLGLISGWINIQAVNAFSNAIQGRLRGGEFESYLMVPVSLISLYIFNVIGILGMIPYFLIIGSFMFLEGGYITLNLSLFLLALLLTYVSNCGISIILGAVHLAYRSVSQVLNFVNILILIFCGILVPGNVIPKPYDTLVLLVPWVQTSLFFGYALDNLKGIEFNPIQSSTYLLLYGVLTLILALDIFKRAELRIRSKGLNELEY